jgi:hypothetical protein
MSIVQTNPAETLDFRQVVQRANRTIRMTKIILGFLTWFAITATTWLGLFALDNLLDLPTALRFPFAITGLIVTIAAFFNCVVEALRAHRSNEQVALMLEEQFGIEENVLINTMQFEEMGYSDTQKEFIRETASAATTGWSHVPIHQLWQPGRMAKWLAAFAVLMSLWIAYSVVAPDYLNNALSRYAFAFQDTPPAAAASLIMTPAEDLTIAEFDDLDITLDVTRFADSKQLVVYPAIVYREGQGSVANDGTAGAEVKMRPVVGNPSLYQYTFETVRRSFSFRIFVGGTYTHSVQVTVDGVTRIVESTFTITPPAYVGQSPREQSGPPYPVKCLPASRLDLLVKLDKPVESLVWQWPAGSVPLQDTGNQVWKGTIEVGDTGGNYDLVAVVKNLPNPIILSSGSVQLKTDRKPEVHYLDMEMSHVVAPGATLPLRFEGKDDYGMQNMKLTLRRAKVGSQPEAIRDWTFGPAPGEQGQIQKRVDLKIDASVFEPGNKYFLEVHGDDFCPTSDSGVSSALLVTVKDLDTNLADGDSELKDLYAALERAIVLQKQALEGTQNLSVNIDDVWLDVNRVKREDQDIQAALDAYRQKILDIQVNVRETLIKGVQLAPDQSIHLAQRMQSIAQMEAVDANHRAFAAGRRRLHGGELKRANGFGPGTSFKNTKTQSVRFKSQPARYFGLVIYSAHGWEPRAYLEQLALVGEDTEEQKSPYLDSSKWKLVASNVKDAQTALAFKDGASKDGPHKVTLETLPASFVFDMGQQQAVTGIACKGGGLQSPKGIAVYLTTDQAPEIVPVPLDQKRINGEFKHLKTVQEMIYNQLLALKGGEFEKLEKDKNLELAKLLGEDRNEAAPSADLAQAETNEKLKEWTEAEEELDALRKVITSKPTENLDEDDEKDLSDLDLKKLALKRDLEEMAEDLARSEWDFADKSEIDLYEATLHNIQDKLDEKNAELLALDSDKPKPDMSHNLDTVPQDSSQEIETGQQAPIAGALVEPGQNEDAEDQGKLPDLGELAAELPANLSELVSGLDDLGDPVPESGSELMDHNSPSGSPASDNLDSASAAGQMAAQTPNPLAKTKGRGNIGRSGQSDGQMAASKAPAIPDNEVAMPARLVAGAGEDGQIVDEDNAPSSAIGLGKATGTATGFADVGKLPPDELNKLKEMLGAADHKSKENIRGLLLALNRHNLPTTDLKRSLERLRQIQSNQQGVDVRQTLNEAIKHMRRAETSLASAYELRAQQVADGTFSEAHQSDTTGGTVPAGYENMVSNYFKAVAEESAKQK